MATPHLKEGILSVIDIDTWKLVKTIKMDGPGFFLRSHDSSPYVWADVFLRASQGTRCISSTSSLSRSSKLSSGAGQDGRPYRVHP